jgi:HlyD family secretion protein
LKIHRRNTRRVLSSLPVLVALVAAGCGASEAQSVALLQATNVVRGALRITAEATGTIEPIRKVEVKSKASGEVLELFVDVGDLVEAGALLARIDPRDVRNIFDQAAADLEVAEARLEISQAQSQRSKELLEGGVITAQEYDNARLDLANAKAILIKARTNKSLAELRLGDVTITAPLGGTIIQKSVEEGQVIQSASGNVSGGTTMFVMANLLEMQVRTLVDETDMGPIRQGMLATVRVEAFPDQAFQGYVEKVEPQGVVQQSVTMFPVIVRLDNRADVLRPGMNADVEILVDEAAEILLVPNNAIVLPQDVGPAALVLGLNADEIDLAAFGGRGRGRGRDAAQVPGAAEVEVGGVTGQAGGDRASQAGASQGALGDSGGRDRPARTGAQRGHAPGRRVRGAVVFLINDEGVPEPRAVQVGLNDYDFTQILAGVDEGAQVALLGAAELQAQQQQFLDLVRQRTGGNPFGGGGFGGGGGRGR